MIEETVFRNIVKDNKTVTPEIVQLVAVFQFCFQAT